jgi:hypothetical protein
MVLVIRLICAKHECIPINVSSFFILHLLDVIMQNLKALSIYIDVGLVSV